MDKRLYGKAMIFYSMGLLLAFGVAFFLLFSDLFLPAILPRMTGGLMALAIVFASPFILMRVRKRYLGGWDSEDNRLKDGYVFVISVFLGVIPAVVIGMILYGIGVVSGDSGRKGSVKSPAPR